MSQNTLSLESVADLLANYEPPPRQTFLLSSGYRDRLNAEFPLGGPAAAPNPLYAGTLSYSSIPMRVMDIPKQKVYDWSACRSPSRAKRRHAKGIPQRVKITEHDVAYMIGEQAKRDMSYRHDHWCAKLLFGGE